MLKAELLPELHPDLVPALPHLDRDDLARHFFFPCSGGGGGRGGRVKGAGRLGSAGAGAGAGAGAESESEDAAAEEVERRRRGVGIPGAGLRDRVWSGRRAWRKRRMAAAEEKTAAAAGRRRDGGGFKGGVFWGNAEVRGRREGRRGGGPLWYVAGEVEGP